jgi:hypothetical protein
MVDNLMSIYFNPIEYNKYLKNILHHNTISLMISYMLFSTNYDEHQNQYYNIQELINIL